MQSIDPATAAADNIPETDGDSTIVEIHEDFLRLKEGLQVMNFPFVWLRDNCQCADCFNPVLHSRTINWELFDIKVNMKSVQNNNNGMIDIVWSDDHESSFKIDWLRERSFDEQSRKNYTTAMYEPEKILWGKDDFQSILRKYDFDKIINDDSTLKDWLMNLKVYGVTMIMNVPSETTCCRTLADRIDFIKKTHYGEEFIVKSKPDTTNFAYSSGFLQLHTDVPYYDYMPGVVILHYIQQSEGEGGENLLCDGLYVSKELKKNSARHYEILSRTPVDWEDIGSEDGNKFHSLHRSPVICENLNGGINRINCSTTQRGSHLDVPFEDVVPWYEAWYEFLKISYKESASFKISEGCILAFDNTRLIHGRRGYKDTPSNTRYLIGVYVDWDYIDSRIRVLNTE